jgi:hypothetical protein
MTPVAFVPVRMMIFSHVMTDRLGSAVSWANLPSSSEAGCRVRLAVSL